MHILRNAKPIQLGSRFGDIAAGEWLFGDQNAFEVGLMGDYQDVALTAYERFNTPNPKSILIFRSGAIGDLLLLTPALAQFRVENPDVKIGLACGAAHHPIFQGTMLVDELVRYPTPLAQAAEWDNIVSLEHFGHTDKTLHITDSFAKALGVSVTEYRPTYLVTAEERQEAKKHILLGRPRVGVQMRASVYNRDYPAQKWLEVILKLEQKGWEVIIFGRKGEIPELPKEVNRPFITNLCPKGLPLRESIAVLSHCDAFVGVDSALIHFCHALDIPAVGLFGPFPWALRTGKAPKTTGLTGLGDCAPCHWHRHGGAHFPPGKPCSRVNKCVVLERIHPDNIVRHVEFIRPSK